MTEEKYGDSYGEKFRKYEDRIADLEKQIEKMKCCDNCQHEIADEDDEEYKTYCDNCENHSKWELKKNIKE